MKKLLLLALAILSSHLYAQDTVLLRLQYNQGEQYNTKTIIEQSSSQGGMNLVMDMDMKVTKATDAVFNTKTKVSNLKIDVEQAGMRMTYDSKKPDEELDQMGKMLKAQFGSLLVATIFATLDKFGNVSDIKIEPNISGMDAFLNNVNTVNYPVDPVSVGDTWDSKASTLGVETVTTFTVNKIADGMVYLGIQSELSGSATGTITGHSEIDIDTGVAKKTTTEAKTAVQGIESTAKTTVTISKK